MKPVGAKDLLELDKNMEVVMLQCYSIPEQVVYQAAKNDYSEDPIQTSIIPPPSKCGEWIVERLLANEKGHYGCYSADTQVLTDNGWVNWPEVTFDTRLAAYNPIHKEIHFEKPSGLQKWEYHDKMYSLSGEDIDVLVSPDHRMVYQEILPNGDLTNVVIDRADKVFGKTVQYTSFGDLCSGERPGLHIHRFSDTPEFWSLVGFWLSSESHHFGLHDIYFELVDEENILYINELCTKLDFSFVTLGKNRVCISCSFLGDMFRKNFTIDATNQKVLPDGYLKLTKTMVDALIKGIMKANDEPYYAGTSSILIDQLQALCCLNQIKTAYHDGVLTFYGKYSTEINVMKDSHSEGWVTYNGYIYCATISTGILIVRRNGKVLVCGNCLEHPQITLSCSGFVHNVIVQARTHRVGVSVDCQSQRYTGKRIIKVVEGELDVNKVFYVRPPGYYTNRYGKKYEWTQEDYDDEIQWIMKGCERYAEKYSKGMCEEHIRDYLAQAIRQNFVISFNLRSVLHFMDLRAKMDAQLEIRALCEAMWPLIKIWAPHVTQYYEEKRLYKARLSP